MDFFTKNWLTLFSIAIAFLGGVPGLINLIAFFRDRPKLSANINNITSGNIEKKDNPDEYQHVLLAISMSNEGKKPITPVRFNLMYRHNNKWIPFSWILIPNSLALPSDLQDISIENPASKDLQRFSDPITQGMPLFGFLMFVTKDVSLKELRENDFHFKLICLDIFGKKHKVIGKMAKKIITGKIDYYRHGIVVNEK